MKKELMTSIILSLTMTLNSMAQNDAISGLLHRILPNNGDATKFEYRIDAEPANSGDYFRLSCDGEKVSVSGNSTLSLAVGINWYLQHKAGVDISWNNPKGTLPATLPVMDEESHTSKVDYRYYLNFCTHSYTMSFWGWERWQQEIDWMALHGINLPLIIQGMECVWREVLMNGYGYSSLDQVNEFVTGGAYYGWFFMNNMTGWGGPQPESWYTQQKELARQIFRRLRDFGMTPVIPGYVGMVPKNFLTYATQAQGWSSSDIVSSGNWNRFERPYFVNNTTRLKEFAAKYYQAIENVFGDELSTHYFAIDPFHEGAVPSGVTPKTSIVAMWEALKAYDSDAIWVAQHWQENPSTALTTSIPLGRLLILDLHGDSNGETSLGGNATDANGKKHEWVWGMTSNFGGNVGLFGRLNRVMESFYQACELQQQNNLAGIGALPEGIENNPMLYDMLFLLPWTADKPYTQETWIKDYVTIRYGVTPEDGETYDKLVSVWTRLAKGVYNCSSTQQQGTTESVFMMRPNTTPKTVSTWAASSWYWSIEDLRTAAYEMLSVAEELKENENYQYDLVDIMRQALADYGKQTLDQLSLATTDNERKQIQNRFLDMILAQDTLLGTRQEFRLGTWTELARQLGTTDAEKALYEKNARMLITTWGDKAQCDNGGLHDYANREWNGLLSSYYYPRWAAFFSQGMQQLSWFDDYEWPFATGAEGKSNTNYLPEGAPYGYGTFTQQPVGNPVETAKAVYERFFRDFDPTGWDHSDFNEYISKDKAYQMIFTRGNAVVGNFGAVADKDGNVSSTQASRNVTTAIAADNKLEKGFCSTLWRFDPENAKTYFINVQTDFYVGNVDNGQLVTTARREWGRPYTVEGDGTNRWVAKDEQTSGNNYLNSFYGDTNPSARNIGYWKNAFNDAGNIFILKEVTALPLSIKKGWAVFSFPVNVTVPEDVEVYALTKVENNTAYLRQLPKGTVLPARQGFMAKAEAAGDYAFPLTTAEADGIDNLLLGVCVKRTGMTSGSYYQLNIATDGTAKLKLATSTVIEQNTAVLPKANVTGAANELALQLVTNDVAVTKQKNPTSKQVYYDLSGRRIGKTQKGIVITNKGNKKIFK